MIGQLEKVTKNRPKCNGLRCRFKGVPPLRSSGHALTEDWRDNYRSRDLPPSVVRGAV